MDHPDAPSPNAASTPTASSRRGLLGPVLFSTVVAALAAALVLVLWGGGGSSDDASTTATSSMGLTPAPKRVGKVVPSSVFERWDGSSGTAADYRGTPLVVNFWAATCTPCIKEMPAFQKVHAQLGDRVAFLGLAVNDRRADAERMAERTGVRYDLGLDAQGDVIKAFGGVVLPTTVIVSPDGKIVEVHSGAMSASELRSVLRDKLGVT
jgi:peroxiredoxin